MELFHQAVYRYVLLDRQRRTKLNSGKPPSVYAVHSTPEQTSVNLVQTKAKMVVALCKKVRTPKKNKSIGQHKNKNYQIVLLLKIHNINGKQVNLPCSTFRTSALKPKLLIWTTKITSNNMRMEWIANAESIDRLTALRTDNWTIFPARKNKNCTWILACRSATSIVDRSA